jgi:drug/metabolite transporter (DMT)-like permease
VTRRDGIDLLLLAALWGGSFLFMRIAAPEFGPLALVFVRVAGASAFLLPLLMWRGEFAALRAHWRPILVVGLINSALPFACLAVAALVLNAGLMAIFNATAPMWTAVIGTLWLKDRLPGSRWLGLAIGFAGVLGLFVGKASLKPGEHGISPALGIAACMAATALYGLAGNYTKARLAGVPPMAVAAGSQFGAMLCVALPAWWWWPAVNPGAGAWAAAIVLALACTGLAYVLYFRLLASAGPANAMTVTLLVPGFAMFWGAMALGEPITASMLAGCAVILLGTGRSTGLIGGRRPKHAATGT